MENNYSVKEQVYASQGKRLANYIIDRIVFLLLFVGLGMLLGIVAEYTNNDDLVIFMDNINPILDYVCTGVFFAIYYILLEGKYSISIGKLVTKTYVVDKKLLEEKKQLFHDLNKLGQE